LQTLEDTGRMIGGPAWRRSSTGIAQNNSNYQDEDAGDFTRTGFLLHATGTSMSAKPP
jgi:hypothetical protein